jgi:hypothetical protein
MRPKIQGRAFSSWEYLGPIILDALKSGPALSSDEKACLMTMAICPQALAESVNHAEAGHIARVFAKVYSEKPDVALRLLVLIHKKWDSSSHRDIAQRFIATHAYLRRPIVEAKKQRIGGKMVTRPHWKQEGILMFDDKATAGEIALAIKAAGGADISKATVTKARQTIKHPPTLFITSKMNDALQHLRWNAGLDVGLGT